MANTRPFTEAHAIACVDVAVMFDSEADDVLVSDISREIGRHLGSLGFKRGKAKKSALTWKLLGQDGERLQEAHLHSSFMHVSAYDYRGWSNSRDSIVQALVPVLSMCASGHLQGAACGLAFVDVFINDSASPYDPAEVFSDRSETLPRVLFKGGERWKQDLSWEVEDGISSSLTIRNRVVEPGRSNVPAVDAPTRGQDYVTEISLRLSVGVNSEDDQAVQWAEDSFKQKLNRLHALNKSVMLDLLSDDMSTTIGLRE